jgi:hypothetical protein
LGLWLVGRERKDGRVGQWVAEEPWRRVRTCKGLFYNGPGANRFIFVSSALVSVMSSDRFSTPRPAAIGLRSIRVQGQSPTAISEQEAFAGSAADYCDPGKQIIGHDCL